MAWGSMGRRGMMNQSIPMAGGARKAKLLRGPAAMAPLLLPGLLQATAGSCASGPATPLPPVLATLGHPEGDCFPRLQKLLGGFQDGGTLHIERGRYVLATNQSIPLLANTTIRCDDGAVFTRTLGHRPVFTTGAVGNVHLIGGEWMGPHNGSASLWQADGTWDFSLESARVEGFATAMNVGSQAECFQFTFAHNACIRNTLTGLSVSAVADLTLRDNTFEGNGDVAGVTHGVYLVSPDRGLVIGNRFLDNCCFGLQVSVTHKDKRAPRHLTITENTFSGNGTARANGGAILVSSAVDGVRDIRITHNLSDHDFRGICMLSGVDYVIADNAISNPGSVGLYLGEELDPHRVVHGLVTRNLVAGSGAEAIQFGLPGDASELTITGNRFLNNARGAAVRPGYPVPKRLRLSGNQFEGTVRGPDIVPELAGLP